MPGFDIRIVDDEGNPLPQGTMGNIVLGTPLAPTGLTTLWKDNERFYKSYMKRFGGRWMDTGDAGIVDEDGYVHIMSRSDDIINVAGHRLSTGAMEEVLAEHPDVAECAVVGIHDEMKGQIPCGFVVLNAGASRDAAEIEREAVALMRERIGPVAAFKSVVTVSRLPKTRSGKILRATMQKIADHDDWAVPATIDDPAVLDAISAALRSKGIGV